MGFVVSVLELPGAAHPHLSERSFPSTPPSYDHGSSLRPKKLNIHDIRIT